ncbi:NAD(P)/FAD-dependent oxidoreductase [Allorhodopirellula solitaria]|uniref:Dihydrolipoamide dehydrogenase n=1 Tax=Allorhodopirellula solitaria TaxID=2527987 RepID=A0A5C5YDZ3_9BACT|nr:FAD-dependent oxidoreductase [Allorhodopirellula solitaria]TWT73033.1 dihydrolipoamide dehydrogenase [Allorhodopirellula solitaria]
MSAHFDVIVVGAGPGGSLTAMQLARRGRQVAMLDKTQFPRFAVGESSTPIASRTLEQISVDFGIDELAPLTRWGKWRESQTQATGGLKRGFTYYDHRPGRNRDATGLWPADPAARLLVAASASDADGDSHWVRAEVDQYLVDICRRQGVEVRFGCTVEQIQAESPWRITVRQAGDWSASETLSCDTLVDASGRAGVILRQLGYRDAVDALRTQTSARFTHIVNTAVAEAADADKLPYRAHEAAVHHLLHDGWVWELRMSDGRTSIGRVWTGSGPTDAAANGTRPSPHQLRDNLDVASSPSLSAWLSSARLAESPGDWLQSARVQHRWCGGRTMSRSFLALPTSLATIDPLHSTGLAHAITGSQRIVDLIVREAGGDVARYAEQVESEIELLDRAVSLAYRVWARCDLFFDACMLYFALAIGDEEDRISKGFQPERATWRATELQVQQAQRAAEAIIMDALKADRPIDRPAFRRQLAEICQVPLACRDDNLYAYTFG